MQDLLNWVKSVGMDRLVWMTDVDMTLIEKSANPSLVEPPAGLEENCRRLDSLTGGRFFIITGRELPYIDALFPNTSFKVSCEYHNVFRLSAEEGAQDINPRPHWELIDEMLEEIVGEWPGMVLRKKPFMRTIHYSHAEDLQNDDIRDAVEARLLALMAEHDAVTGHNLSLIDGGQVFDMGPGGMDKGSACAAIMDFVEERDGKGLIPVYFGDSPGDIAAAEFVQAHGGKFVAIGDDPRVTSIADFRLADPAACRAFIAAATQPPAPRPRGPELL